MRATHEDSDHDKGHDDPRGHGHSGKPSSKSRSHQHAHLSGSEHATATSEGLRVVALASLGMFVVAAIELLFFALSGSAGLLSDALHNLGDVLTTVALVIAFQLSRRMPTPRYPYGYSRAEDLTGAFIVIIIVGSAIAAAWESWRRLIEHIVPTQIGWGIAAACIGFIGNEALAMYKINAGRRLGSAALVADGQHSRIDGVTSLAAAAGLALAGLGLPMADPLAGLLISVAILYILVETGRDVVGRLMDRVEPQVLAEIRRHAATSDGVRNVTEVRARWAGRRLFVALTLTADAHLRLIEAHAIAERARQEILTHIAGATIVDIHVDPDGLPQEEDPHTWQRNARIER